MKKALSVLLCIACEILCACGSANDATVEDITEVVLDDIFYSKDFDPLTYWSAKSDSFDLSGTKSVRTYMTADLSFTITTCIQDANKMYILQVNDNPPGCVYITDECVYLYMDAWDGWTQLLDYDVTHFENIITSGVFTTDIKMASNNLEYVNTVGYCDIFRTVLTSDTEEQIPVRLSFDRLSGKLKSITGDTVCFSFEPLTESDFVTDFNVTKSVHDHAAVMQAMWDFQKEIILQEEL